MRRAAAGLAVSITVGSLAIQAACGSDDAPPAEPKADGGGASDAGATGDALADATDPRCGTQAVLLGTHPHAVQQPTELGKTISDVRGFGGHVYLAYGDLEANTGPIYITSWDPGTKAWVEHPLAYVQADASLGSAPWFATQDIERFVVAAGKLWAPAAQTYAATPFDTQSAPEYAVGSANNEWAEANISPNGLHMVDMIERAPGDLFLTGSGIMQTDASQGPTVNGRAGGFIWRSQDGGPFNQLFPDFSYAEPAEFYDLTGSFIFGAALNGIAYFDVGGFIEKFDGNNWDFNEAFGEFLRPVAFAGQLVFADLGHLYTFDGTTRHDLEFRFFESPGRYQGLKEPLALFQVTEDRLLAVRRGGDVMMTTDLKTWSCIGKAPADATAIGSLGGVVYFGSVDAQLYAFPSASW